MERRSRFELVRVGNAIRVGVWGFAIGGWFLELHFDLVGVGNAIGVLFWGFAIAV